MDVHEISPDDVLVDRLRQMRDGFGRIDPAQMLARTPNISDAHAARLLQMVADADEMAARGRGECDWCGVEVDMSHQCPFLADLPACASGLCDCGAGA